MNPLESAFAELKNLEDTRSELLGELAGIELKIKVVKQSVHLLNSVYDYPNDPEADELLMPELTGLGITDRIRQIFRSAPDASFSPTHVRDTLAASGFQVKGDNPMATIHTILKRLVVRREIESRELASGTIYSAQSENVGDVARDIADKMRPAKHRLFATRKVSSDKR